MSEYKKSFFAALAVCLVIAAIVGIFKFGASKEANEATRPLPLAVSLAMDNMARRIGKQLPENLDDETRLDSIVVGADRRHFLFNLTYLKPASSESPISDFAKKMQPILKAGDCAHVEMRVFLENGVTIRHNYHSTNGTLIETIEIKPTDCRNAT